MALAVLFKIKTVGRLKLLLKNLDDYIVFDKVIDGAQKYVKEFDEKYYQPFINKITSQCSCKNGFDFFEHSYYSNLGIPFSIESPDNSNKCLTIDFALSMNKQNQYEKTNPFSSGTILPTHPLLQARSY